MNIFFDAAATSHFVLDWRAPTIDELHDGDRFRVTITSAGNEVLTSQVRTVAYQHVYPNGADCDTGCKVAMIDATLPWRVAATGYGSPRWWPRHPWRDR